MESTHGEQSEITTSAALERSSFATNGFLCLAQALPMQTVQGWSEQFAAKNNGLLEQIFQDLHQHGHTLFPTHCRRRRRRQPVESDCCDSQCDDSKEYDYALGQGIKHGFCEIVMRSPGRYEIAINDPTVRGEIVQVLSQHLPFVPLLLCDDEIPLSSPVLTWETVKIVNVSIVVSTPGAPAQAWHADGSHVNLDRHLTCHCLNIFIPLTAVTAVNGPTELRPESHYYTRHLTKFLLAAKARKTLKPCVAPIMTVGDCLLFDYRILHRGLANNGAISTSSNPLSVAATADNNDENNNTAALNRTILVVAVAQPWFKDVVNFPSRSLYDGCAATKSLSTEPTKLLSVQK